MAKPFPYKFRPTYRILGPAVIIGFIVRIINGNSEGSIRLLYFLLTIAQSDVY